MRTPKIMARGRVKGAQVAAIAAIGLAIILLASPLAADEFFVSQTGDDLLGDGSSGNPWRTVTFAIQSLSDLSPATSHTVHVGAGHWHAEAGEYFPISIPRGVTIMGAGTGITVFSGYPATSRRPPTAYGQVLFRFENSATPNTLVPSGRLTQITAMHARSGVEVLGDVAGGPTPLIDNCMFWRNQIGVTVTNAAPQIENCRFETNQMGISAGRISNDPAQIEVRDNILVSNSYGINAANAQGFLIERNRFEHNGTGIMLGTVGVLTVTSQLRNNIYWRNGQGFVSTAVLGGTIKAKLYHETFYENTTGVASLDDLTFQGRSDPDIRNSSIWASSQHDTNGVSQDEVHYTNLRTATGAGVAPVFGVNGIISVSPKYVDAQNGDFHLSNTSPLIDRGTRGLPGTPVLDIDGEPREIGAPDLGVDELATFLTHLRSGSRPGELRLFLNVGNDAGLPFAMGASYLQSTTYGVHVSAGRTIPLFPDRLFFLTFAGGAIPQFSGQLNGVGQALVRLDIPNVPLLAGSTFYVVFITIGGSEPDSVKSISNVVRIDTSELQ